MKISLLIIVIFFTSVGCKAQDEIEYRLVGGPCEGCEAVFEYGDRELANVDTIPGFSSANVKLKISGIVYNNDVKSPAKDVILYFHQTNEEGIYLAGENETGWGLRHGSARGWVKTVEMGLYILYTFKPGIYPDRSEPAHIHLTVLEPNGKYYWLNSYLFKGDPYITEETYNQSNPRGGNNGIISLSEKNELLFGKRDIVLGDNIPGYD